MTSRKHAHLSLKLSLYLDGRLEGSERDAVGQLIASDPDAAEEFRQLSAMRELLAERESLPANPFLAERVMNRIRDRAVEEDDVFAIPRRLLPVATSLAVILLSALAVFAWLQREEIFNYVEQTGSQMQQAY